MCQIVVINKGEKEITTPRAFEKHFGFMPDSVDRKVTMEEMDECLCGWDIEGSFKENRVAYKTDAGDYFVGMLDEVKGDNE